MLDADAQPESAPLPGETAATMPWAAEQAASRAEPERRPEPETEAIPPAPDWPAPAPEEEPEPEMTPEPEMPSEPEMPPVREAAPPPPALEPPPPAPPTPAGGPGPHQGASPSPRPAVVLPVTWPVTLSGWLIGAGSLAAAVTLVVRLGNPLNLLIFVALLAIAASVFLVDRVPSIPNQRMAILVVLMVSLGVALERAAFRIQGVESIFLIAMIVAAGGALLLELGRDRPVPPLGGAG